MDHSWRTFVDPRFELRFRYPDPTPHGAAVTREESARGETLRVHLLSDRINRELYIELMRFPAMPPEEEYERHRAALDSRFGAGAVSALEHINVDAVASRRYTFAWPGGKRVALLVPTSSWLYRLIYNPASELNEAIIETLAVNERLPGARP